MLANLSELLHNGEIIQAAIYCMFKKTGFFVKSNYVSYGHIAITNQNRLVGYMINRFNEMSIVSLDMNFPTKVKISKTIFGQKLFYISVDDGKKSKAKFQVALRDCSGRFPNQKRNLELIFNMLKLKQNL